MPKLSRSNFVWLSGYFMSCDTRWLLNLCEFSTLRVFQLGFKIIFKKVDILWAATHHDYWTCANFSPKSVSAKFKKYSKHISLVINDTSSSKLSCSPCHSSRNVRCNHCQPFGATIVAAKSFIIFILTLHCGDQATAWSNLPKYDEIDHIYSFRKVYIRTSKKSYLSNITGHVAKMKDLWQDCLVRKTWLPICNKANLRDLIAATSLIILLKLDSNRRFFSPFDLEIWWMTSKNYRAPLLHYIKLCASS